MPHKPIRNKELQKTSMQDKEKLKRRKGNYL
jgi:hypothetical protein